MTTGVSAYLRRYHHLLGFRALGSAGAALEIGTPGAYRVARSPNLLLVPARPKCRAIRRQRVGQTTPGRRAVAATGRPCEVGSNVEIQRMPLAVRWNDQLKPLWFSNTKVAANFACQVIANLHMSRNGASLFRDCVMPSRMAAALMQ